jgi:hypothetical protein
MPAENTMDGLDLGASKVEQMLLGVVIMSVRDT